MSAGTLYQSSDASAPSLTDASGSLNAVLRACLVDGYGAKAAAGWSILLEDGDQNVVYQNDVSNGGIGAAFVVTDDGTVSSGRVAAIAMFESISDFDTGINGTPKVYMYKSNTSSSPARPWRIVADDKFVHLFVTYNGTVENTAYYYFGDIIPEYINDRFHSVLCASADSSIATVKSGECGLLITQCMRPMSQAGTYENVSLMPGPGMHNYFGGTYLSGPAYPYNGQVFISYPYVRSYIGSYTAPRGRLPGVHVIPHLYTSFSDGTTYTIDTVDYFCIIFSGSTYPPNSIFFDLVNFRP